MNLAATRSIESDVSDPNLQPVLSKLLSAKDSGYNFLIEFTTARVKGDDAGIKEEDMVEKRRGRAVIKSIQKLNSRSIDTRERTVFRATDESAEELKEASNNAQIKPKRSGSPPTSQLAPQLAHQPQAPNPQSPDD